MYFCALASLDTLCQHANVGVMLYHAIMPQPADIPVHVRNLALDISIVSSLHPSTLCEARTMAGAVFEAMESKKHYARFEVEKHKIFWHREQVTARRAIYLLKSIEPNLCD